MNQASDLTKKILMAMMAGIIIGLMTNIMPSYEIIDIFINAVLDSIGQMFISALKLLVIPVVFVSLVCGVMSIENISGFAKNAFKTIVLYIGTTVFAISMALLVATLFKLGASNDTLAPANAVNLDKQPGLKEMFIQIIPDNIISAMSDGNMLGVIIFAILLGLAIVTANDKSSSIRHLFKEADTVVMNLVHIVFKCAPFGIFCLVAVIFYRMGIDVLLSLWGYFLTVIAVYVIQISICYPVLLYFFAKRNPIQFYRDMSTAMLFAFSTSSSNASIPVVLETCKERLKIKESIASFVIPLGATINMDGTAIMQGVATVFIANIYHVPIELSGYLMIILTATLASIGTAGVPSVGLITLSMVLSQVNIPTEGIALIIGIDRILDMLRTVVNITGDCTVAAVVDQQE